MRVAITTDGGFTGRGIGSATADVDDAAVRRALDACELDDYPSRGRDVVLYELRAGGRTIRWRDDSAIPEELRELFDTVWRQ